MAMMEVEGEGEGEGDMMEEGRRGHFIIRRVGDEAEVRRGKQR